MVYNYYLEINKGNKIKSLISYKGIESKDNIYLVYKVLEIEKGLKWNTQLLQVNIYLK